MEFQTWLKSQEAAGGRKETGFEALGGPLGCKGTVRLSGIFLVVLQLSATNLVPETTQLYYFPKRRPAGPEASCWQLPVPSLTSL